MGRRQVDWGPIFAWLAEPGHSLRQAAREFGLPEGTVFAAVARRRHEAAHLTAATAASSRPVVCPQCGYRLADAMALASPPEDTDHGRKSKYTDDLAKEFVDAVTHGATDAMACVYAGIDESTFYRWMGFGESGRSPYRQFRENVMRARARCSVLDLATITAASRGTTVTFPDRTIEHPNGKIERIPGRIEKRPGDWRAAAWRLARRNPEFADQSRHTISGDPDAPLKVAVDLVGASIEDLRRLAADPADDETPP